MNLKDNKITIIVESPNKIKTITTLLKDTPYKNAKVLASIGHIIEIEDGTGYFNSGIDVKNEFKPSFKILKDKEKLVKDLKQVVKASDMVFLCTDNDREGEAIAWALKEFLKIPSSKCYRATFHEITKKAVIDALNNPRKIDDDLVHASHARQKLDKLLGYRMSTIARDNVGAKSVGRCQSAGLELIAEREKSIQEFIPEKYGELIAVLTKEGQEFKAKYFDPDNKDKKPSYNTCLEICETIDKSLKKGEYFKVESIERKTIKSNPKSPFITSTFQQEVSNKLGIGVEQAMSYAQKLFEGINVGGQHIALITYIRTDDATFSPEFLETLKTYVKSTYGDKYYSPVKEAKNNENAQAGHEAIRPVDLTMTPSKLKEYINDERLVKVYEIIYRRTIACAMAQSLTSETTYVLSQSGYMFNMVSKELVFDGYQKVYNYKEKEDDELIKVIFDKGEQVKCKSLDVQEKETTPPSRYKEATFIKELEKTGIGRPSTYATILKTLKDESRGYCTIQNKCLVPTDKGIKLANFLKEKFPDLINVEYTSNMEHDLDKIANGKLDEIEFLNDFLKDMENAIKKANLVKDEVSCPKCGAPMKIRKSQYGVFYGCTRYPECDGIIKINKKH